MVRLLKPCNPSTARLKVAYSHFVCNINSPVKQIAVINASFILPGLSEFCVQSVVYRFLGQWEWGFLPFYLTFPATQLTFGRNKAKSSSHGSHAVTLLAICV
jgi:hypothetical protein